jgi:P27 family predicted phage terminase small subunit
MGKRGPKAKPTALCLMDGDPGRLLPSRLGELQPPVSATVPKPPRWLGKSGKAVWRRLAWQLHGYGLLTVLDYDLFGLYCDAHDQFHEAHAEIKRDGYTVESQRYGRKPHPAIRVKNRAALVIRQFGADFGLSPVSRVGLNVGSVAGDDELDRFSEGHA